MSKEKEKLINLLNEYYGDTRDDSHKEEIADFIESNIYSIAVHFEDLRIMKKNLYRFYWLDGTTTVWEGYAPEEALTKAGYGAGAVRALDFYETNEPEQNYFWNTEEKIWRMKVKSMGDHLRDALNKVNES